MRRLKFLFALSLMAEASAHAQRAALTPFATQKAAKLLHERLSCLGCHRLGGAGGLLAPALDGLQARRSPAYIAAVIGDPRRVVPGAAMPRVRMPASERSLITRYLGGDAAAAYVAPDAPSRTGRGSIARPTSAPADGSSGGAVGMDLDAPALYGKWCSGCHGARGNGDGPNAPNLPVPPARHADAAITSLRSDDALYDTIYGGGAIMNRSPRMPAFGGTLTDSEIRGLVRYIRLLCRCDGPSWSRIRGGV